ncbi:hypothetical protein ACLB2K_061079 [Fragaria x ananassa]
MLGDCAKGYGESGGYGHSDEVPSTVNGQQIHGFTVKLGFEGDLHLNNSLLDMYAKNADMKSAQKVFASIPEVSVVFWNVMITEYGLTFQSQKAGRFQEAEVLLDEMPYKDDPVIWEVLISSCRVHANVSSAKRAADELILLDHIIQLHRSFWPIHILLQEDGTRQEL